MHGSTSSVLGDTRSTGDPSEGGLAKGALVDLPVSDVTPLCGELAVLCWRGDDGDVPYVVQVSIELEMTARQPADSTASSSTPGELIGCSVDSPATVQLILLTSFGSLLSAAESEHFCWIAMPNSTRSSSRVDVEFTKFD